MHPLLPDPPCRPPPPPSCPHLPSPPHSLPPPPPRCSYELPWEDESFEYPASLAPPLQILVDASNGASDYGNKFGEPLVCGYTRTFGQRMPGGERREWIKPIMFRQGAGAGRGWAGHSRAARASKQGSRSQRTQMLRWRAWMHRFLLGAKIKREYRPCLTLPSLALPCPATCSGGLGQIDHSHLHKNDPALGMLVVKIGGPAYRIGMGGGAASSVPSGSNSADLDFNAVQVWFSFFVLGVRGDWWRRGLRRGGAEQQEGTMAVEAAAPPACLPPPQVKSTRAARPGLPPALPAARRRRGVPEAVARGAGVCGAGGGKPH